MLYDLQHDEVKVLLEAISQMLAGEFPAVDEHSSYTIKQGEALERARAKLLAKVKPSGMAALLAACLELEKHSLDPFFIQQQQADTKGFVLAARAVVVAARNYGKDGTETKINRKLRAGALRYLEKRAKDSKVEASLKGIAEAFGEVLSPTGDKTKASAASDQLLKEQAHEQKIVNWLIAQVKAS